MNTASNSGTIAMEISALKTEGNIQVRRFTLKNRNGVEVTLMSWGGTITHIVMPGGEDVTLGFDTLEGYTGPGNMYLGAVVGRVANRTSGACFELDGRTYRLDNNDNGASLHGGVKGFDKVNWESCVDGEDVVFSHYSADGEGGFPGHLVTSIRYSLTETNMILMQMRGMASEATPLNLTSHAYFNLAGHDSGSSGLYDHTVIIHADYYTPHNQKFIPTGKILPVDGTLFDLRGPGRLGDVIHKIDEDVKDKPGYAHNFVLSKIIQEDLMRLAAEVNHPPSGRSMKVFTNQPGAQFYTSTFLPQGEDVLEGKQGAQYRFHGAFCIETQKFPDFLNNQNFPSGILRPGEVYTHNVGYQFHF